jgi:hypothetical protein
MFAIVAMAFGSLRICSTVPSIPGQPGASTLKPLLSYREAQPSQL